MSAHAVDIPDDCVYNIASRLEHEDRTQLRQVNTLFHQQLNRLYTSGERMSEEQRKYMQDQSVHITLASIRTRHNAANTNARRVAAYETTKNLLSQFYMIKSVAEDITDFICGPAVWNEFYNYARTPEAKAMGLPCCCTESSFVRSLVLAMRYHVNAIGLQDKGIRILSSLIPHIHMRPCHVLYESMAGIIQAPGADRDIICEIIQYMTKVEKEKRPAFAVPVAVRSSFIAVVLDCIEKFRFKGIMPPELYNCTIMNAGVSFIGSVIASADYAEVLTTRMFHVLHRSLTEKNAHPQAQNALWSRMSDSLPTNITLMIRKAHSNYNASQNADDLLPIRLFVRSNILYHLKYRSGVFFIDQCQDNLMAEVDIYANLVRCGFRAHIDFRHIVEKAFNILQPVVSALYGPKEQPYVPCLLRGMLVETVRAVGNSNYITAANKDLQTLLGQHGFVALAVNKIGMYTRWRTMTPDEKSTTDVMFEWTVFLGALLYQHTENQGLFIRAGGMQNLFSIALQSCDFMQTEIMGVLCTILRDNELAVHQECPYFVHHKVDPFWGDDTDTTFAKTMARIATTEYPPPIDTTVLLQVYETYKQRTPYIEF